MDSVYIFIPAHQCVFMNEILNFYELVTGTVVVSVQWQIIIFTFFTKQNILNMLSNLVCIAFCFKR